MEYYTFSQTEVITINVHGVGAGWVLQALVTFTADMIIMVAGVEAWNVRQMITLFKLTLYF